LLKELNNKALLSNIENKQPKGAGKTICR